VFRLILTLALAVTVVVSNRGQSNGQSAQDLVTVFTAKRIITMDPGWSEATAVAIQNGRILSVGTLSDLKPWLDKYPHRFDRRFENNII
jgi:hypothetical protein